MALTSRLHCIIRGFKIICICTVLVRMVTIMIISNLQMILCRFNHESKLSTAYDRAGHCRPRVHDRDHRSIATAPPPADAYRAWKNFPPLQFGLTHSPTLSVFLGPHPQPSKQRYCRSPGWTSSFPPQFRPFLQCLKFLEFEVLFCAKYEGREGKREEAPAASEC